MTVIRLFGKLKRDVRGGTAIEYGLIMALVVIAMLAAFIAFAHTVTDNWGNVATKVTNAGN